MAHTFGCAWFVYNYMLKALTDAYNNEQKRIGYHVELDLISQQGKFGYYAALYVAESSKSELVAQEFDCLFRMSEKTIVKHLNTIQLWIYIPFPRTQVCDRDFASVVE
ncbi:MAG: helix-turn-helix domain-containing protein [Methylotenera sp.]|nr:helix-turn-helix domain-containing protein [Methylotenera sp.]